MDAALSEFGHQTSMSNHTTVVHLTVQATVVQEYSRLKNNTTDNTELWQKPTTVRKWLQKNKLKQIIQ